MRKSFVRTATAVLALLVMLVQGTWVLAGTTGGLTGTVADAQTGRGIANAKITVASPSQSTSATSDASGRYTFVSLAPDTYTVTITSPGYQTFTQPGVTVVSDQTINLNFTPAKQLQNIGRTSARSSTDLVKPGQTADVYTITGQLSQNTQGLGSGTTLFQTFSALASVPGVYVPQGTTFGQNTAGPYIRGGDYSQVGFEYDGIPVNRAFDNYVANTQGITGQQELQVYTGGVSASSAGQGLSGYINQVIKTGTYPATGNAEGVIGGLAFYHYLRGELGGATPNRNFSYYMASTGWNQGFRYADQKDGSLTGPNDLTLLGFGDFDTNGAGTFNNKGGLTLVPYVSGAVPYISTRETIGNFHIGLPHGNGDGGRDDIQLLASAGRQFFTTYDSFNFYGGYGSPINTEYNGGGPYQYSASQVVQQPLFSVFNPANITNYYMNQQPKGCPGVVQPGYGIPANAPRPCNIDPNITGREDNQNGLYKFQYQKNLGSTAYVRLYGYSNYSAWLISDPGALAAPFTSVGSLEYQLSTHTRGVSLDFADQVNNKNLITGSASYTFAQSLRANQYSFRHNTGTRTWRVQLVDPNGFCYSTTTGALANCYGASVGGIRRNGGITSANYTGAPLVVAPGSAAATAGAQFEVTQTGFNDVFNQVQPKFANFSLTDQIQFSDKFKMDIGARYNSYVYGMADTSMQGLTGGDNNLLFTEFNREHCFNPATRAISLSTAASGFTCAAGLQHTDLTNTYPGSVVGNSFEPRVSGTYSVSPYTVIRFSGGKYSQPINSAYTQYNVAGGGNSTIGSDLPGYTAANFFGYGFNSPRHDARPQISYNYDISLEQRLKNTPITFSLTPFFRRTKDQSQSFFLDPTANFVSGLNVGTLKAYGVEFLTRYGDFNRDGISGQLAFAYTNSKLKYENFQGTSRNIVDNINGQLVGYNGLTQSGGGSPCYVDSTGAAPGTPSALVGGACPVGTLANPYFNSPQVGYLDRNAYYSPYDLAPAAAAGLFAVGSSTSYEVPYTTTVILQYRKNGLRVVPTFQYDSGFTYGNPFTWVGYDPSQGACPASDTSQCMYNGATIFRPNPYTGSFDKLGQFKSPGQLTMSMQVQKDFSRHLTGTAIFTNIFRKCFTRGYAWEQGGSQACGYFTQTPYVAGGTYLGNGKSPAGQYRVQNDPFGYAPGNTGIPFNAYFSLQWKL